MAYDLDIDINGDILRVEIFGERSRDPEQLKQDSHAAWREIAQVTSENRLEKLLVVSHAKGDYSALKAYEINSTLDACGVQRGWTIAFANLDENSFEDVRFAETVAVNRGFKVGVFQSEDRALSWLLKSN